VLPHAEPDQKATDWQQDDFGPRIPISTGSNVSALLTPVCSRLYSLPLIVSSKQGPRASSQGTESGSNPDH
jgi:hypothetical protein